MTKLADKILSLFYSNPYASFNTTEIAEKVFSSHISDLNLALENNQIDSKSFKRKSMALNRKCIYHLNSLVSKGVLSFNYASKGLKVFTLVSPVADNNSTLTDLTPVFSRFKNSAILEKSSDCMSQYDLEGWYKKFNGLGFLFSGLNDSLTLLDKIKDILNDFLVIYDCDSLFTYDFFKISDFFETLNNISLENNFNIVLTFRHSSSYKFLCENHSMVKKVQLVFFLPDDIGVNLDFVDFKVAVNSTLVATEANEFYLQAKTGVHSLPSTLSKDFENKIYVFSSNCFIYNEYKGNKGRASLLLSQCLEASKDFFKLFAVKRELSIQFFGSKSAFSGLTFKFENSYNCISMPVSYLSKKGFSLDVLKEIEDDIFVFCKNQQRVFKSCGVPVKFKVKLISRTIKDQKLFDKSQLKAMPLGSKLKAIVQNEFMRGKSKQVIVGDMGDSTLEKFLK